MVGVVIRGWMGNQTVIQKLVMMIERTIGRMGKIVVMIRWLWE